MSFIPPLADLIDAFQQLPGVGPKTAQRYAMHMLQAADEKTEKLVNSLQSAKADIIACEQCHQWCMATPCKLCTDTRREQNVLCVVESAQDVFALERTQSFHGKYHVLGGLLSPMDGIGPDALNIKTLLDRVQSLINNGLTMEVLFALSPSTNGEMTSLYMARQLKPLGVNTTRIAYGLPVGGDLDYADQLTLSRALDGRQGI